MARPSHCPAFAKATAGQARVGLLRGSLSLRAPLTLRTAPCGRALRPPRARPRYPGYRFFFRQYLFIVSTPPWFMHSAPADIRLALPRIRLVASDKRLVRPYIRLIPPNIHSPPANIHLTPPNIHLVSPNVRLPAPNVNYLIACN
jgi:hypothetical protein